MSLKNVITGALLFFVAASVVYLVAGESPRRQTSPPAPTQASSAPSSEEEIAQNDVKHAPEGPEDIDESGEEPRAAEEASRSVVAYYFHGARRCDTCRTIEAYAAETLKSHFAEQMDDEKLTWSVINLSEADNEHFVQDFELSTRTIVLVEMQGGEQVRWKSLPRVWELVGDKEAFGEYIREETQGFLGG